MVVDKFRSVQKITKPILKKFCKTDTQNHRQTHIHTAPPVEVPPELKNGIIWKIFRLPYPSPHFFLETILWIFPDLHRRHPPPHFGNGVFIFDAWEWGFFFLKKMPQSGIQIGHLSKGGYISSSICTTVDSVVPAWSLILSMNKKE